ncbi:hypothetical protein ACRASX_11525 [Flavobacterium sp. TMP13]|uniref:hypothetical protein n=1 Tax=Flavobacterium sp. TMP13 TaxID=3425950 RepID=UPI003D779BB6
MKTLKISASIVLLLFAFASAQAQLSVNVNIGSAPVWGPPVSANVDYYFLPDINTYYDLRASQYVYQNQGRWIRSRNLPVAYRNYDLRHGRTIIINDYHGRSPYDYHHKHQTKYRKNNNHYYGHNKNYHKHYDKHYNKQYQKNHKKHYKKHYDDDDHDD